MTFYCDRVYLNSTNNNTRRHDGIGSAKSRGDWSGKIFCEQTIKLENGPRRSLRSTITLTSGLVKIVIGPLPEESHDRANIEIAHVYLNTT